jgi:hypothetical protein
MGEFEIMKAQFDCYREDKLSDITQMKRDLQEKFEKKDQELLLL